MLSQAAHAEAAFVAAREAHALSLRLDQARRQAQEEAAARSRAERELERELAEHMRAEEAVREARDALVKANLELECRVKERTASLQEALAQMEEFSYSVSHDLRTPLRAMSAYAEVLLQDYRGRLDETAASYLEKIWRGSQRMDKLTLGLLNYSRIARADLKLAPVDVEQLIGHVVTDHRELQPPTQIHIDSPLHRVLGHELSLGQAIANLLNNAVKFRAPTVTPHIYIRSEAKQELVRLWFTDNGIGIDPHVQHRLFCAFERIHPDKDIEGTGIGLAIVRKAVEKMGGKVGVVSDGVNGSSFWIELRQPRQMDAFAQEQQAGSFT
ncbi:MAG TPA: ATP-binding protein [Methylomirabilota bacterium]|nr:ATP-binding protein [Methylomirabilota bacterium]